MRFIVAVIPVLFYGCFMPDEAVEPYPRGDAREATIEIGEGYNNQVFYSLEQNRVVKTVRRLDWDLALDCEPGSRVIRMNTSRSMYAAEANDRPLAAIKDTTGLRFKWDVSSGNPDSTAIRLSSDTGQFVINLGYGENFEVLGFRKISFRYRNDTLYFNWYTMDNASYGNGVITKDTTYNHQHYSLLNNSPVSIEPPRTDYDLFFTQYIYYFVEEDIPYMVSGVLLNPYRTSATQQQSISFQEYGIDDLELSDLSSKTDIIGYDWKWYDLNNGVYVVDSDKVYAIRTSHGFIYKMHFTDYYNNLGISGYPRMEQQKL